MSDFRPSVAVRVGVLTVTLAPTSGVTRVDFDCVIDQTDLGDVVGIEVLDLEQQLAGGRAPVPPSDGFPGWSYDKEIDAFYVRVADGRGQVQKAGSGTAYLDQEGQLSVLEVRVML